MVKMADIRIQSLHKPIDVSEYLFRRLHEVGVRSVHGVPGDYNLVALDYLSKCGLQWVGSVNELNAGTSSPRTHQNSHRNNRGFGQNLSLNFSLVLRKVLFLKGAKSSF